MVHLGAAIPNLKYALDTHYPWQSDEIIIGGRFKFEDGQVAVPTGAGLGVELDREALAKLHQKNRLQDLKFKAVRKSDLLPLVTLNGLLMQ